MLSQNKTRQSNMGKGWSPLAEDLPCLHMTLCLTPVYQKNKWISITYQINAFLFENCLRFSTDSDQTSSKQLPAFLGKVPTPGCFCFRLSLDSLAFCGNRLQLNGHQYSRSAAQPTTHFPPFPVARWGAGIRRLTAVHLYQGPLSLLLELDGAPWV